MKFSISLPSIALALILIFVNASADAQCPYPFASFGSGVAPSSPGTSVVIEPCTFVGESSSVLNVQAGVSYSVSYTGGVGDYVVIYDATFTPVAFGFSPLCFTATASGTYYSVSFIGAFCNDFDPTFSCNTLTWTNQCASSSEFATACTEYTWPFNNQTYTSSGTYLDSVPNGMGGYDYTTLGLTILIDSVELSVSVGMGNTLQSQSTLGNYQWIDCSTNLPISGATNQSFTPMQTGNYAVIISDSSCVDTSACTMVMVPTFEYASICDNYTWPFNNQTYTGPGTYVDSVPIPGGFQVSNLVLTSIITPAELAIVNSNNTLTSQSTSGNYQWIDCSTNLPIIGATSQTFTPTQTGSYAVIISDNSCVDTSACAMVIVPTYDYITNCSDYTWAFNNQTYTASGTYVDSVQIVGGFQTAYLVLNIFIDPANLIVVDSASTLYSQSTVGTYQWIDCATNLPISGATNQSFTPTQSGSYAVIITDSACVDTSACTTVQGVGIQSLSTSTFSIVPNPTSDIVTISFDGNSAVLVVSDVQGKIMYSGEVESGDKIDLSIFDSGIYYFNLQADEGDEILRIIRQ